MYKLILSALVFGSLIIVPAHSVLITDADKCRLEIETVKSLDEESDVGPKFDVIVKDLIGVLEHLCETKSYSEAADVGQALRIMLATEEPADGPKNSD